MDWKTIGISLVAIVFAGFVGARFLRSAPSPEEKAVVEKLSAQYTELDARVAKIEKTIASLSKDIERTAKAIDSAGRRPEPPSLPGEPPDPPRGSKEMAPPPSPRPPVGSSSGMPGGRHGMSKGLPTAWMDKLTEEKRKEVGATFERHAQAMRDAFPEGLEAKKLNPEDLGRIMKEHDQALKSELKAILTEEEYAAFLSSLPSPPQTRPGFQESGPKPSTK